MALYLLSKSVPKPNSKPRSHIADMLKNRDENGSEFHFLSVLYFYQLRRVGTWYPVEELNP
nr:MAG TPA: hypothetical protein [Caudoviricetes sp.]